MRGFLVVLFGVLVQRRGGGVHLPRGLGEAPGQGDMREVLRQPAQQADHAGDGEPAEHLRPDYPAEGGHFGASPDGRRQRGVLPELPAAGAVPDPAVWADAGQLRPRLPRGHGGLHLRASPGRRGHHWVFRDRRPPVGLRASLGQGSGAASGGVDLLPPQEPRGLRPQCRRGAENCGAGGEVRPALRCGQCEPAGGHWAQRLPSLSGQRAVCTDLPGRHAEPQPHGAPFGAQREGAGGCQPGKVRFQTHAAVPLPRRGHRVVYPPPAHRGVPQRGGPQPLQPPKPPRPQAHRGSRRENGDGQPRR
eukprot:RCo055456